MKFLIVNNFKKNESSQKQFRSFLAALKKVVNSTNKAHSIQSAYFRSNQ